MSHAKVLAKLERMRISTTSMRWWTRSWLRKRLQLVMLKEESSQWRKFTSGISLEINLRTPFTYILFNIFISNLGTRTGSVLMTFANDTKMSYCQYRRGLDYCTGQF